MEQIVTHVHTNIEQNTDDRKGKRLLFLLFILQSEFLELLNAFITCTTSTPFMTITRFSSRWCLQSRPGFST